MRTLPILHRGLDLPSQGVIVLLSFLALHGCCLNNRGHVHSPVAPGPARGLHEGVVSVEPQLTFTQPPLTSPLIPPLIPHLGNSTGDTKDQDAAQALFHQGPQHLF